MALTDIQLRALKAKPVPGKHGDRDGLFVRIDAKGSMRWQWRIRTPKGESTVSYGCYPEVGLAKAREFHRDAREKMRAGINPNESKKAARRAIAEPAAERQFEPVGREWFALRRADWAPSYADRVIRRLEADVFPWLGKRPVDEIKPPELLAVLRRIEARGVVETAHRALVNCSQVFRYAIATGRATTDPGRDLKDALVTPMVTHFPAITDPVRMGQLMRAAEGYKGTYVVRAALRLAPMLLLRPGELRHGRWAEFNLDAAEWTVPPARMKRKKAGKLHGKPHIVPLPRQAVAILRDLFQLTGPEGLVFPGERDHERPMSDATLNAALRALGFPASEVTGHGFRATARTLLAEKLKVPDAVIEAQLAHSVKDSLGRAYNRTEFLDERRKMMQRWADYLDRLRTGASVVAVRPPQAA